MEWGQEAEPVRGSERREGLMAVDVTCQQRGAMQAATARPVLLPPIAPCTLIFSKTLL